MSCSQTWMRSVNLLVSHHYMLWRTFDSLGGQPLERTYGCRSEAQRENHSCCASVSVWAWSFCMQTSCVRKESCTATYVSSHYCSNPLSEYPSTRGLLAWSGCVMKCSYEVHRTLSVFLLRLVNASISWFIVYHLYMPHGVRGWVHIPQKTRIKNNYLKCWLVNKMLQNNSPLYLEFKGLQESMLSSLRVWAIKQQASGADVSGLNSKRLNGLAVHFWNTCYLANSQYIVH